MAKPRSRTGQHRLDPDPDFDSQSDSDPGAEEAPGGLEEKDGSEHGPLIDSAQGDSVATAPSELAIAKEDDVGEGSVCGGCPASVWMFQVGR